MTSKWTEQTVVAGQGMNRKMRRALKKVPEGTVVLVQEEEKVETHGLSQRPRGGSAINPQAGLKR